MTTALGELPREAPTRSRLDVKALVVFFALAYVLSWLWAFPLAVADLIVLRGEGWPTHYPALFGPAIAAGGGYRLDPGSPRVRTYWLGVARWRVPLRWWLVARAGPAVFLGLALIAMAAAGNPCRAWRTSGSSAVSRRSAW